MSVATDAIQVHIDREDRMRDLAIPGSLAHAYARERADALRGVRGAVVDAEAEQFVGD